MENDNAKTVFSKTNLTLSLFAVSGWLAFYMRSNESEKVTEKIVYKDREVIKEKIVYRDKEIFKAKIVYKDIVKTVTKPDGTTIVTVSKVDVKSDEKTKEQIKEIIDEKTVEHIQEKELSHTAPSLSRSSYSFGVSIILDYQKPLDREYEFQISRRLWVTPVWGSVSINTQKELELGIRWEK